MNRLVLILILLLWLVFVYLSKVNNCFIKLELLLNIL